MIMKAIPLFLVALLWFPAASLTGAGCPSTPTSYCVSLPPGYTAFANHLEPANLSTLLGNPVALTTVFRLNNGSWNSSTYDPDLGGWDDDAVINNGEGILIHNPSPVPVSISIAGAHVAPGLPLALRLGFNLVGRQEVGLGSFESIVGYPPGGCPGMRLYRLDPNLANQPEPPNFLNSIEYAYDGLTWSPSTPVINVGEAVFIYAAANCSGILSFSVSGVFPSTVGGCGVARMQIIGSALLPGSNVILKRTGEVNVAATNITSQPGGFFLEAIFDLAGASPGTWDVEVTSPSNVVQTIAGGTPHRRGSRPRHCLAIVVGPVR